MSQRYIATLVAPLILAGASWAVAAPQAKAADLKVPYGDAKAIRQLADRGNAEAQFLLGFRIENGGEGPPDAAAAATWYRKSADQGFAQAQFSLAIFYADGQGVPRDIALAVSWFRKAAEQGLPRAQANLGIAYASGNGVPQDYEQATEWWRKAAEQGDEIGQFRLGLSYFVGLGVPRDQVEAHRWLNIAASHAPESERKKFVEQRDDVAETMTPAQIIEAQRRATAWLASFQRRKQ